MFQLSGKSLSVITANIDFSLLTSLWFVVEIKSTGRAGEEFKLIFSFSSGIPRPHTEFHHICTS